MSKNSFYVKYFKLKMEALNEISQFLDLEARLDLKVIALQYVLGLSGSVDGVTLISNCDEVLKKIIMLIHDKVEAVRKDALLCLVNISAEERGSLALMKYHIEQLSQDIAGQPFGLVNMLLNSLLNIDNKDADAACMVLCNMTRSEENLQQCVTSIMPLLPQILDAFTNVNYNKAGSKLNYLGPLLSNLSSSSSVRSWLCQDDSSKGGVSRVASFCQFEGSTVRRGGAVGTLRNICFDTDRHAWLLGPEVDMLTYLLLPLAGGEEFPDDEMDTFPISLQYLQKEKQREQDPDIRILLLETLSRLCTKKAGREYLRNHGTYYILRELHKWEKDRKALLACENVVDILIKKEEEMGADDISSITVPEEYHKEFIRMDEEFLNDN